MGKPTGFMEYARRSAAERSPSERIRDWRDLYLPLSEDELRAQGARCRLSTKSLSTVFLYNNTLPIHRGNML